MMQKTPDRSEKILKEIVCNTSELPLEYQHLVLALAKGMTYSREYAREDAASEKIRPSKDKPVITGKTKARKGGVTVMDQKLWDDIISVADKMRERTAMQMVKCDAYQKCVAEACQREEKYHALDLTDKQRKVIDELLESRDKVEREYSAVSYLSGIADCCAILRNMGVIDI